MDKKLYFHLGLPKTASTFLQRNVFPHFRGIRYTKKHDFHKYPLIIQQHDDAAFLFSNEMEITDEPSKPVIEHISHHFPDAVPIIFLRDQKDWIISKYKYYIRKHGHLPFEEYFPASGEGVLKKEDLFFYPKIEHLLTRFRQKPLVYFYDELKKDPQQLISTLASDMGAQVDLSDIHFETVKKSYSEKQLFFVRKFNAVFPDKKRQYPNKVVKWFRVKPKQFLLHGTAYCAALLPDSSKYKIIPDHEIDRLVSVYESDWQQCRQFAAAYRTLIE